MQRLNFDENDVRIGVVNAVTRTGTPQEGVAELGHPGHCSVDNYLPPA